MLRNMANELQRGGLGALYWGYAPFVLKALPYDVAELFTYSQLTQLTAGLPRMPANLPPAAGDLLIGAQSLSLPG